jgi:hypothetical protein
MAARSQAPAQGAQALPLVLEIPVLGLQLPAALG